MINLLKRNSKESKEEEENAVKSFLISIKERLKKKEEEEKEKFEDKALNFFKNKNSIKCILCGNTKFKLNAKEKYFVNNEDYFYRIPLYHVFCEHCGAITFISSIVLKETIKNYKEPKKRTNKKKKK